MGVAIAGAGHRHVDGEHQGRGPRVGRLGQQVAHERPVAQHIELEPDRRRAGLGHFLQVADRDGRQAERHALGGRGLGRLALAAPRVHARQSHRGQGDRQGLVVAEQRGRQVGLGDVLQNPLAEAEIGQVRDVAGQGPLGIGAAVDIVEQEAGQLAPRRFPEVRGGRDNHWTTGGSRTRRRRPAGPRRSRTWPGPRPGRRSAQPGRRVRPGGPAECGRPCIRAWRRRPGLPC
jgi:hypothetical protein